MSPRVLIAMSGGVDSSVAAAILCERGYDVVGVAMRLAPETTGAAPTRRRGICCSHEDFEDARRVAERMDFPFYLSLIHIFQRRQRRGRVGQPGSGAIVALRARRRSNRGPALRARSCRR